MWFANRCLNSVKNMKHSSIYSLGKLSLVRPSHERIISVFTRHSNAPSFYLRACLHTSKSVSGQRCMTEPEVGNLLFQIGLTNNIVVDSWENAVHKTQLIDAFKHTASVKNIRRLYFFHLSGILLLCFLLIIHKSINYQFFS